MIKLFEKNPKTTIVALVFLMLLPNLDVPNITIMEARNFITAREMVDDGNWILTTMNGEPRYQKPPLPTWLSAVFGLKLGTDSLFGLRFPAIVMIALLGLFAFKFSERLKLSNSQSLQNALITVTSFYIIAITNEAPWDIFTHSFMFMGLYFIFQFFESDKTNWKLIVVSGLLIAASILSKGPVSLYALFLPFLIAYGVVFKFQNMKQKAFPLIAWVLLFLIVGGSWFVYVRYADPEAFLKITAKETGNWSSYNVRPFYYYWSFFTQSGLWTLLALAGLFYPFLKNKVEHKKVYRFTFIWTIAAVILLSIIPEKKARYLVPVLIPLALNTGFYVEYMIQQLGNTTFKKSLILPRINFFLFGIIGVSLPVVLFIGLKDNLNAYLSPYILTSFAGLGIGYLLFKYGMNKEFKNAFYSQILLMFSIFCFGLPISKAFNNNSQFSSITELHKINAEKNIKTYSIYAVTPEMIWAYDGKIKNVYKNEELKLPEDENFGLLILKSNFEKISKEIEATHTLDYITTFDHNPSEKKRDRLMRDLYYVTKK